MCEFLSLIAHFLKKSIAILKKNITFVRKIDCASFSTAVMAQEETTPVLKDGFVMNSFWSNWFVEANASYTAFYSNEEKSLGYAKSPLEHFRRSYGLSFAIGKRFTPVLGLRTKISGFWGKSVLGKYGKGFGDMRVGETSISSTSTCRSSSW